MASVILKHYINKTTIMKKFTTYILFLTYFLTSCNNNYPETFYGIRLGKNSKEEFLKAKKDQLISINDKNNEILITFPFGGVTGKIDFWTERVAVINTEGVLSQIDITFYNKIEKNNDEYLMFGKYQQNLIVNFFEQKYGVIDKTKTYTDLNDETKNHYYLKEVIDIGYGFPKIKQTTYQWLNDNLKIRLILSETEDNKYLASASYFYSMKHQSIKCNENITKKANLF